jgi:NifU-like protein involved in Fe-S cluster formation
MAEELTKEQQEQIHEHYHNPKNMKVLTTYNARGIGRNPDNWGQVDMYLLVDKDGVVIDLGYEFKGCPTIAFTASVFTEELKGVPLEEAYADTQAELDIQNAQNSCDDCVKMILVAFIAAYWNFKERNAGTNLEDYTLHMIEITAPKTETTCG